MNRIWLLAMIAALLVVHSAWAQEPESEQLAIRKVLDDQVASWNRSDLEGFMTGYWRSPKLTFFSGKDKTSGWDGTLARYRKRYQSEGSEMGRLAFTDLEIETLGPQSAFVRGQFRLVRGKETLGGRFTLVFRKLPGGWRIVHDHTSG